MLLSQIIFEQAIETRPAADVWGELESGAKTYAPSSVFYVKEVGKKFEVYTDKNNKREKYAEMDADELHLSYEPVRPNDKPDGEGFSKYRSKDELQAAKYEGDPVNIEDGSTKLRLKGGDYLVRSERGDEFVYTVEPGAFFDNNFSKV